MRKIILTLLVTGAAALFAAQTNAQGPMMYGTEISLDNAKKAAAAAAAEAKKNNWHLAISVVGLQLRDPCRDLAVVQKLLGLTVDGVRFHLPGVVSAPVCLGSVARLHISKGKGLLLWSQGHIVVP